MAYKKKNNRPPRPGEGRPKLTVAKAIQQGKLPENWKDIILEMSVEGKSEVQIRAALITSAGVNAVSIEGLWYALRDREEEFLRTLKIAKGLCQAWWEEQGRVGLMHSSFSKFEAAVWFANMKNRFGWQDKLDVVHDMSEELLSKYKDMSPDELVSKTAELARIVLTVPGTSDGDITTKTS